MLEYSGGIFLEKRLSRCKLVNITYSLKVHFKEKGAALGINSKIPRYQVKVRYA